MEAHDSGGLVAPRSDGRLRRATMAIVLTAGVLTALTAFSGVGLAGTHGTPACHQYGGKHCR